MIAATALEHGLTLVTRNVKDFAALPCHTLGEDETRVAFVTVESLYVRMPFPEDLPDRIRLAVHAGIVISLRSRSAAKARHARMSSAQAGCIPCILRRQECLRHRPPGKAAALSRAQSATAKWPQDLFDD